MEHNNENGAMNFRPSVSTPHLFSVFAYACIERCYVALYLEGDAADSAIWTDWQRQSPFAPPHPGTALHIPCMLKLRTKGTSGP